MLILVNLNDYIIHGGGYCAPTLPHPLKFQNRKAMNIQSLHFVPLMRNFGLLVPGAPEKHLIFTGAFIYDCKERTECIHTRTEKEEKLVFF